MSILDWANKEVEIACKKENPNRKEGEFDYGCACYESALKAFKSLCEDNHSGFSIGLTRNILMRLIDNKPLTPIEDTEDIWNDITYMENFKNFQCKRMSSLFKNIYPDGTIKYSDVDRYYCIDIDTKSTYTTGIVNNMIDEMYPITMPYYPSTSKIVVFCETFLVDPKNGDFDTKGILYLEKISENGYEKVEINRYFREPNENEEPTYHGWVEIDKDEYETRKTNRCSINNVE